MDDRPEPVARRRRGARFGAARGDSPAAVRRGDGPASHPGPAARRPPVRRRARRRAAHDHPQSGRLLHPARGGRPDRIRRVLHGGRLGLRGPDRPADRLRGARRRPRADAVPAAADHGRAQAAARRRPDQGGRAPQHRPPLRPVQRVLRPLPRPDHDVLLGPVRDRRRRLAGRRRPAARAGAAAQDRPAARPGAGRARQPAARGRHRLGRAGDPGRQARRAWSERSRSPPGSTSSRPAGWPRPGWPIGSAWSCAITATCPASTTPSARSRWSRRSASATGTRTSPSSTSCSRPAAGSRSSRSRCRTTG